ncbi:MAG TPA: DinB family protein [Thermoanaerobaculia bacterium]|jgi:uncharacterized damage-inducible protein DinB
MSAAAKKPFVLEDALIEAWATHAEITRYLLENLDEKAWSAEPPGGGRTVAAIVAHVHNVRRMMLVMHAKGTRIAIPPKLDRHKLTPAQAQAALGKSAAAIGKLIESAPAAGGRVAGRAAGVAGLFAAAVSHEAHHRGQICMLARQLGSPLSEEAHLGMWDWSKRARAAAGK